VAAGWGRSITKIAALGIDLPLCVQSGHSISRGDLVVGELGFAGFALEGPHDRKLGCNRKEYLCSRGPQSEGLGSDGGSDQVRDTG